jgi:hypothetical protein
MWFPATPASESTAFSRRSRNPADAESKTRFDNVDVLSVNAGRIRAFIDRVFFTKVIRDAKLSRSVAMTTQDPVFPASPTRNSEQYARLITHRQDFIDR